MAVEAYPLRRAVRGRRQYGYPGSHHREKLRWRWAARHRRQQAGRGRGLGAAEVAKAAPDGYTIMGGTISTHAINASLYKDLPYDPVKDFVAITLIARVPNMLVVNNDFRRRMSPN